MMSPLRMTKLGSLTFTAVKVTDISSTKRIPGLKDLTYCQRLTRLKLDSLELRRVRLDLIFTYKLVFGLTALKLSDFFCTAQ